MFTYFLFLYLTRITKHNHTPYPKPPKNKNRRVAFGRPVIKLLGGLPRLSSRSHPRHLEGKRTAQKDTIIDITSDSQVNSNFPYRWSPASLTFTNYIYLFLYLYITRITINNNAPHLKSLKNQKQKSILGTASNEITAGGGGGGGGAFN